MPDLVIYLQAAPETLIERVQRRGVAYEKNIPEAYLIGLAEAYTRFFYQYTASPLLIVNSDRLNFVESQDDLDAAHGAHRRDARAARVLQPRRVTARPHCAARV